MNLFCLALPTIFHIFSNYVPMEERSRSFSYLIALGSVGQTFAALVDEQKKTVLFFFTKQQQNFLI